MPYQRTRAATAGIPCPRPAQFRALSRSEKTPNGAGYLLHPLPIGIRAIRARRFRKYPENERNQTTATGFPATASQAWHGPPNNRFEDAPWAGRRLNAAPRTRGL